jgi:hypothetical protein
MGSDKKSDKKKSGGGGGGGGYKWGSALIWAGGQWAVCWFVTPEKYHLWAVVSACFSAAFAGWTTSALLSRFAKWGANNWVMMLLGTLLGVAVFSGAFSGLAAAIEWFTVKGIFGSALSAATASTPRIDWEKLQDFLLSWAVLPPAGLGLLTGLYVRGKFAGGAKK